MGLMCVTDKIYTKVRGFGCFEEFGGMQKEVMIKLEGKFPPLYIHGFS